MSYKKFEKLLAERGLTANKVAKETGIPYTCLYDWKTGRSTPKFDKIQKLATYFGVSFTYFIE